MKIIHVVGARPNFMKLAPVHRALSQFEGIDQRIVHTGQHYDRAMSELFFEQLGIPEPDKNLGVGSADHATQTARIIEKMGLVLRDDAPESVIVYGDVNSTVAAALVATKLGIHVTHVEAGLRSGDFTMPEEINRRVTDSISNLLLAPSVDACQNLAREGVPDRSVALVGNVMIDTLVFVLPQADSAWSAVSEAHDVDHKKYCLVTIHRASNTDNPDQLRRICRALESIADRIPVVFPVHPRTRSRLNEIGYMQKDQSRVILADPLGYLEFLALQKHAAAIVTDSGGVQEESTYLRVPCLTLRANTERPVTISSGTNQIVGTEPEILVERIGAVLATPQVVREHPIRWDGLAGQRAAEAILADFPGLNTRTQAPA